LVRIWSTDFWIDPIRAIDVVDASLQALLSTDREKQAELSPPEAAEVATEVEELDQVEEEINQLEVEEASEEEALVSDNNASVTMPTTSLTFSSGVQDQLSAQRFYEKEYLPVLADLAGQIIDGLGPVTFRALSTKIARLHNFNRTGSQIKKQVWAAISKKRKHVKSPNGETVFWPEGQDPQDVIAFRGMTVNGELRSWQEVPYPERIGLIQEVVNTGVSDPILAIAQKIGLERIRQVMRDEIETLIKKNAMVP